MGQNDGKTNNYVNLNKLSRLFSMKYTTWRILFTWKPLELEIDLLTLRGMLLFECQVSLYTRGIDGTLFEKKPRHNKVKCLKLLDDFQKISERNCYKESFSNVNTKT